MSQGQRLAVVLLLVSAWLRPGAIGPGSAAADAGVSAVVLAASDFTSNTEGWTVVGDAVTPLWKASGGNPAGYAEAVEQDGGDTWYWAAPAKFLGNMAAAYGGALRFDLRQSSIDDPFDAPDLVLEGNGLTLFYETAHDPDAVWTSYSVILQEEVGWRRGGEAPEPATAADMRAVLANLTALHIRGEFQNGADTGGLDSVALNGPAPGQVRVPGTAVIFLANRSDITIPPLGGDLDGFPLTRNCLEAPCEGFLEETFPIRFGVAPGATVTVSASGGLDYYGFTQPSVGPEGDLAPGEGSIMPLAGISGFDGPEGALVGVFLSGANPQGATPPDALDFGPNGLGTGFASLRPALNQVFFIGDGLTGTGTGSRQTFIAPAGAARLFLGIADAYAFWGVPGAYDDNMGAFYVLVSGVPRPAGYLPLAWK